MLQSAARAVAAHGAAAHNHRAMAPEAGVSHTAPRHHFGDKRGLLTALAADGYGRLADRLAEHADDFLEAGVAYVRFALENPGHFAVMYRPDLVDEDDRALGAARARTGDALLMGAETISVRDRPASRGTPSGGGRASPRTPSGGNGHQDGSTAAFPPTALLAWSAAHGLANLALAGTLTRTGHGTSIEELTDSARRALRLPGGP